MNDRTRGKPLAPQVQVIRKPAAAPASPTSSAVRPSSVPSGAIRPAQPPFRGPARGATPRPPPSSESVLALAKKERVPNRIARGELEGKMKCRIWKKLHPEEAKRFDQAWTLLEATPGLDLPDAFGIVQSGMSVDEFMARRARIKRREAIKEARSTVVPKAIDDFIAERIAQKSELAIVLGESTVLDVLTSVAPISFTAERTGLHEKIHVVLLARKKTLEAMQPTLERDAKLSHKPASVARQPARRPVSDPRGFLPHVGERVALLLRNGIKLELPLLAVGPFDVLVGTPGDELFIPLHAMHSWTPR